MTVSALDLRARVAQPIRKAIRSDFVRHGALVFGATMLGNVLNYVFNFAISRRLGVEGFATLSSLMSVLMIVSIPATVLNLIVVKYTAEFHAAGDAAKLGRFARKLLAFTGFASAAIFLIGLLLTGVVADFLRIPNDGALILCAAVVALGFTMPSARGILQGEQNFKAFSISTTIEILLKVSLGVSFVYAGFGVIGAMFGWLIGTSISLIYTTWAVRIHRNAELPGLRLRLDLTRLVTTSVGIALSTGTLTVLSFIDVVLVKHYFSAHDAGYYAAVNLTGKIVLFVANFLPLIVLPKAIAKARNGESPFALLAQATVGTFLMCGATLAVFGLMPARVIALVAGHQFAPAAQYVFQYDAAMAMLAFVTLLMNYKIALHRFDFLAPVILVVAGEITMISLFHHTLRDVIDILTVGNAIAIAACCYRIAAPAAKPYDGSGPEVALS